MNTRKIFESNSWGKIHETQFTISHKARDYDELSKGIARTEHPIVHIDFRRRRIDMQGRYQSERSHSEIPEISNHTEHNGCVILQAFRVRSRTSFVPSRWQSGRGKVAT